MSHASLVVAVAAGFALGAQGQTRGVSIPAAGETATPLQRALGAMLTEREAAGLPVPSSVRYSYDVVEGAAPAASLAPPRSGAEPVQSVTIVGRTVLRFDNPEQAGYAGQWPRLDIRNAPEATFQLAEGDYTEAYRAIAEAQIPGIWDRYEFGREPRTYTFEETLTLTVPQSASAASSLARALETAPLSSGSTLESILMGFTYQGLDIDHTVGASASVEGCLPWPLDDICVDVDIFNFKAGFQLSWALGLRLPGEVTLQGPARLASGSSHSFSSHVVPSDWSAGQYSTAGVAAESGNEFVLRENFFVGLLAEIAGQDLCTPLPFPCNISSNIDKSATFETPFGTGPDGLPVSFPIPNADVPLYSQSVADLFSFSLGFRFVPHLGSSRITASAGMAPGGAASAGGALTYSEAGTDVGTTVNACIQPGAERDVRLQLSDFRYWFNEFLIELQVYGSASLVGFGSWDPGYTIASFDLSRISGNLSLGKHVQCDWDFDPCSPAGPDNVIELSAYVADEAPPVTTLAIAGAAGKDGWYRSNLTLSLSASDNPPSCGSGVAATEYTLGGTADRYVAPITVITEGTTPFLYGSTDVDGNGELTVPALLKIDKTAPAIEAKATTSANGYGWYGHDVTVHFIASDALSGIDTVTPDATLSSEGAGQSATGTALDLAGNSASATLSGLNIDKTPPTLDVTSPPAAIYPNTASVVLAWNASDAMSGIAVQTGLVDGEPVPNGGTVALVLFTPGPHAAYVEVVDKADHVAQASVRFEVTVDLAGLLAAHGRVCDLDWINKYGICASLEAKLTAAQASWERGDFGAAANQLEAYLHELDAQWNKAINPRAYDLLRLDAEYVLAHLG